MNDPFPKPYPRLLVPNPPPRPRHRSPKYALSTTPKTNLTTTPPADRSTHFHTSKAMEAEMNDPFPKPYPRLLVPNPPPSPCHRSPKYALSTTPKTIPTTTPLTDKSTDHHTVKGMEAATNNPHPYPHITSPGSTRQPYRLCDIPKNWPFTGVR